MGDVGGVTQSVSNQYEDSNPSPGATLVWGVEFVQDVWKSVLMDLLLGITMCLIQ
jgi:hypothetical protein